MIRWYLLDKDRTFSGTEAWPEGSWYDGDLVAFARRPDNDDIACFHVVGEAAASVVTVHGYTSTGYEVIDSFDSVWDWLKAVIDDICDWVGLDS